MLKRALVAVALAAATAAVIPAPAQAAKLIPGDSLTVIAYFDSAARTNLVGQKWWGCNQPSGSWGITTAYSTLYFPPC
ncbi:MAG TPA: DUF6289 family protein [Micromonosporaceae bacterium]